MRVYPCLQIMRDIREQRKQSSEATAAWRDAYANAVMGGTSRACAVTLLCPMTLVKTRMESSGAAAAAFVTVGRVRTQERHRLPALPSVTLDRSAPDRRTGRCRTL